MYTRHTNARDGQAGRSGFQGVAGNWHGQHDGAQRDEEDTHYSLEVDTSTSLLHRRSNTRYVAVNTGRPDGDVELIRGAFDLWRAYS